MAQLEIRNVTKRFGGLVALKNVSISTDSEILGIIGPNGSGKTTLFNVLSGVYRPSLGQVIWKGKDITGKSPHAICRMGISRTYQIPRPFGRETIRENVRVAGLFGMSDSSFDGNLSEEVEKMLEFVGLSDRADAKASTLNLHQRRMLEVARALITRPSLLLLDEVASGLTPSEVTNVVSKVRDINSRGVAVLWIEHVMKAIIGVSTRVVVLDHGEVVTEGPPAEVVNNQNVIKAYLGFGDVPESK